MKSETEEAIQNIGNFCKNLGEGSTSFIRGILLGGLIILGILVWFFVVPWIQCEILDEEWCNIKTVAPAPRLIESIDCTFEVFKNGEWIQEDRVFQSGWQEVKTYIELFPDTKIIQCEGRFKINKEEGS